MKKTLLASAIALAFAGQAWANPTNTTDKVYRTGDINPEATANSQQTGGGALANENSKAIQKNGSHTNGRSQR